MWSITAMVKFHLVTLSLLSTCGQISTQQTHIPNPPHPQSHEPKPRKRYHGTSGASYSQFRHVLINFFFHHMRHGTGSFFLPISVAALGRNPRVPYSPRVPLRHPSYPDYLQSEASLAPTPDPRYMLPQRSFPRGVFPHQLGPPGLPIVPRPSRVAHFSFVLVTISGLDGPEILTRRQKGLGERL